ncbi:molecular chaperone DnaJ [Candidatus Synchoanobacter obligatus]|uniref:Chaperone protein DnaJ n=1 Tax=Candidatus Synchoanobacter obligatus TaxID=2919597 RepID=A0ABT1L4N1_9GAMM|nr:molecular chaperone DnaJ [Candidatus Synchoanobacter obligatus]MCP8352054.1 molecular chaperone DnaJ [Candidatus Synchoanobacter obligatus]
MKKDFYELLGVDQNADDKTIKSAYKKLALKYHPDRLAGKGQDEIGNATKKFKAINEAYSVLSNKQKRQAYDSFGDPNASGHNPFEGFGGQDGFPGMDLNDILNNFFGGGGGGHAQPNFQGSDLGYTLSLSLEEAASGIEKEIAVHKKDKCQSCQGSGSSAGSKTSTCATCRGQGKVTMQQGFMAIQQLCPSCHGEGVTISNPCQKCKGKGCYSQNCKIKVRIPAGVDTGDRMRVSGKGDAGVRNAPSGDLYISINVKAHRFFERDGSDLHCKVPISFYHACVGGDLDVATLSSTVKLKIPPETQSGTALRLRGKGIKNVKTNRTGDIICHINTETPVKLTAEQKDLLKSFEHSIQENTQQPQLKSFFERIKTILN